MCGRILPQRSALPPSLPVVFPAFAKLPPMLPLDHQCACASNYDVRFIVVIRKVTEYTNKVSVIRCRRSVSGGGVGGGGLCVRGWGGGGLWGGVGWGGLCVGGVGVGGGLPSLSVYVIIAIVHSVMFIRHMYCFSVTTRGQLYIFYFLKWGGGGGGGGGGGAGGGRRK